MLNKWSPSLIFANFTAAKRKMKSTLFQKKFWIFKLKLANNSENNHLLNKWSPSLFFANFTAAKDEKYFISKKFLNFLTRLSSKETQMSNSIKDNLVFSFISARQLYSALLRPVFRFFHMKQSLDFFDDLTGSLKRPKNFENISPLFWRYCVSNKNTLLIFCQIFSHYLNFILSGTICCPETATTFPELLPVSCAAAIFRVG